MGIQASRDALANDDEIEFKFIGRQNEINDVKETLKSKSIIGITGMRKIGKSRVLLQQLKAIHQTEQQTCLYHDFEADLTGSDDDLIDMIQDIIEKVREDNSISEIRRCSVKDMVKTSDAIQTLVKTLVKTLTRIGKQKETFVFLDNVDKLFKSKSNKDTFLSFMEQLSKVKGCKLKTLFTTSEKIALGRMFGEVEIGPMKMEEIDELIRGHIEEMGTTKDGFDFGEGILNDDNKIYLDIIVNQCEGLPFIARMVASELLADQGILQPVHYVQLLFYHRVRSLSLEYYPPAERLDLLMKDVENVEGLDLYFFQTLNRNLDETNRQYIIQLETEFTKDTVNKDYAFDLHGTRLIDLCKTTNLLIANGRLHNDKSIGDYSFLNNNGMSVVDYLLLCNDDYAKYRLYDEYVTFSVKTNAEVRNCFKLLTQPCIMKYLAKTKQIDMHAIFRECIFKMTGTDNIDDKEFRDFLIESGRRFGMGDDLSYKEMKTPKLFEEYVMRLSERSNEKKHVIPCEAAEDEKTPLFNITEQSHGEEKQCNNLNESDHFPAQPCGQDRHCIVCNKVKWPRSQHDKVETPDAEIMDTVNGARAEPDQNTIYMRMQGGTQQYTDPTNIDHCSCRHMTKDLRIGNLSVEDNEAIDNTICTFNDEPTCTNDIAESLGHSTDSSATSSFNQRFASSSSSTCQNALSYSPNRAPCESKPPTSGAPSDAQHTVNHGMSINTIGIFGLGEGSAADSNIVSLFDKGFDPNVDTVTNTDIYHPEGGGTIVFSNSARSSGNYNGMPYDVNSVIQAHKHKKSYTTGESYANFPQ